MNRKEIIDYLEKMNLPKDQFVILAGASLVMQGVKATTHDIDIAVSESLEKQLLEQYPYELETVQNGKNTYFIDNVLNFSTNLFDVNKTVEDTYFVQTLDSVILLKKKLGREKDLKDIALIESFIKNNN